MTADSVFVLSHDMDIARCSNGKGRVNDMTYEQLLAYDFGSWKGRQFVGEKIPVSMICSIILRKMVLL